ncbi:MAG: hypothetical protein KDI68_07555 [Gammaproteobacteria bacterium]|nr:hypothetical protein [Gammaproteobacteria bacterium]
MMSGDELDLLVLDTGLFADSDTVSAALAELPQTRLARMAVDPESMTTAEWDRLLQRLLQAEKVITL